MAARASGGGSNEALKPRAPSSSPPKVVQTFLNHYGEVVGLLDDNPRGLPVVLIPTAAARRRVEAYGSARAAGGKKREKG